MAYGAFISYAESDREAAEKACEALEHAGIPCWIAPRDVPVGKEWAEAIIDAISDSRVMLLLFSAEANRSQHVRREVERAVHKQVPILTVRLEEATPAASLEFFLAPIQWLDAFPKPLRFYLPRLTTKLHQLLDKRMVEISPGMRPTVALPAELDAPRRERRQRFRSSPPIARFLACILLGFTAVWLVYLAATNAREVVIICQNLKSSSIAFSAIFIGAVALLVILRRVLATIDGSTDAPKDSRTNSTKAWPTIKTAKTLAARIATLSPTQRKLLEAAVNGRGAYVFSLERHLCLGRAEIMYRAKELERDQLIEFKHFTDVLLIPTAHVFALLSKPEVQNAFNQSTEAATCERANGHVGER